MPVENQILLGIIIIGLILYWVIITLLKKYPPPPDPWEKEDLGEEEIEMETPICMNCSTPIANPSQHYCPKCGNITGEYTRYVPFVNIKFNYSIFGTLWKKFIASETALPAKIFYIFIILILAPIMLIIAVPALILFKPRRKLENDDRQAK